MERQIIPSNILISFNRCWYIWGRNFFIKKYNTVSFIIMQKSDLFFANLNLYWVLRLSWGYTYTLLQGSLSSTIFLLKSVFSEISVRTWVQAVWDQKMGLWLADLFCLPIRGLFIGGMKQLELMYWLGSLFSWALRTREDRYNGTFFLSTDNTFKIVLASSLYVCEACSCTWRTTIWSHSLLVVGQHTSWP